MSIKPPKWAKNAIPTSKGWVVGNELVIARRHTEQQLVEYFNVVQPVIVPPAPVVEPVVEPSVETEEVTQEEV